MTAAAPASSRIPAPELVEYLLDLGGTLLSYGCPTHRLEQLIAEIAAQEGYQTDTFAVPTGLWMSMRRAGPDGVAEEPPLVRMVRVKDWGVDLARLAAVNRLFNDVVERKVSITEARRRLDEVERTAAPYPRALQWLAGAAATGASALFFRGGWGEVFVAAVGGVVLAALRSALTRIPQARLLQDFVGGLVAAAIAWGATAFRPDLSREVLVLSVVILLVPGMAMTSGLAELAHKNLVSGASRLMEALMTFLSILTGIAVIVGLESALGQTGAPASPRGDFGILVQIAALIVTSLAFGVLFAVPRRLLHTAVASGALAWLVIVLGSRHVPGSLAAFAAAAAVCFYANGVARLTERPAQIFLLPGLVLLVPGSFGYLSLEAFLRGEFVGGAAKGFEMFLIAGAIVTGLLVGNVLLPARKIL